MPRRRWLQFSLRFLFAAIIMAACVAWWFRPGVVKPAFVLERFSRQKDGYSGKERIEARIRLTNAGLDSIWLDDSHYYCKAEMNEGLIGKADANGWQTVGGIGFISASHGPRIRLRSGESLSFAVPVDYDARSIQLGVEIADRRGQRQTRYWSPSFLVPNNLFNLPPD
jgi:hypothetical protein